MNNNVNIINICSLVIGNNLPWSFRRQDQLPNPAEVVEPPVVDKKQEETASEGAKTAIVKPRCPWRGLVGRMLIVGGLALALSLWCGCKRKRVVGEEE